MATGSNQASHAKAALGKSDLRALHSALYPARNSYKSLGLQIGVEIDEIVSIEGKYADHSDRLLEILSVRVKQIEPLTWNDIDTTLRLDCVGESKTADNIRKKYGHLFGPDPSIKETSGKKHEEQYRKERLKKKKKIVNTDDHTLHVSNDQEEDSDGEVRGRVRRNKYSEQPEESDENSSATSSEEQEKL